MINPLTEINCVVTSIALRNDEHAYKRLFVLLFSPLKKFSSGIVKSNEVAEEIADDVMITLWKKRNELSHIENIRVYAFVIAKNLSLNFLKKQSGRETISIDEIDLNIFFELNNPEQVLICSELKSRIEHAVQALPPKCRMIFKLVKEAGLSYKETAEILNLSVKTVDAHLVTAVRKIAVVVKDEFNLI
jgi:RNA polymerase sigma-70 factor (ECF subfamily)